MCPSHMDSTCSDERFDYRRGPEVFLNEFSMRNEICPEPCWSNYSIGPMPPSDEDLYLTDVWMLLMRTAWERPYFTMGVLIT